MIFPGISTATNLFPLLGAGQRTARSDPPRAAIDRNAKRPAAVERRSRIVRVYVVGLSTTTAVHRAIHGKALMSVSAVPIGSQPQMRFLSHRPASGLSRWHGPRTVQTPETLSRTATYFRLAGPTAHRRALPGHANHHRPNRKVRHSGRWLHRRRSRSDASMTADDHRGRSAQRPDPQSTRRHAAMSDPDQEPGEHGPETRHARTDGHAVSTPRDATRTVIHLSH